MKVLVFALAVLTFFSGCVGEPAVEESTSTLPPEPSGAFLEFTFMDGACAGTARPPVAVKTVNRTVFFTGRLLASDPCHTLAARLQAENRNILVHIEPRRRQGACIQCAAEIPFAGEIRNLTSGEYLVRFISQGAPISASKVSIPPAF